MKILFAAAAFLLISSMAMAEGSAGIAPNTSPVIQQQGPGLERLAIAQPICKGRRCRHVPPRRRRRT